MFTYQKSAIINRYNNNTQTQRNSRASMDLMGSLVIISEEPCRTCLRKKNVFVEIFSKKESSLLQMLTSFTHLQFMHDDLLPKKICGECKNQIINCFNFKMLCENTDNTLRGLACDQLTENETAVASNVADEPPIDTEDVDFVDNTPPSCNDKTSSSYKCSVCLIIFCSIEDFNEHNAKHVRNKPYRCTTGGCRRSFVSPAALQVHSEVNHAPSGAGAAHTCRACGRTYRHARTLRQHLIAHSEPRRFSCQHCQRGFTLRHHLTAHEKTHSKEKPFLCQQCAACFATKERLQVHIKRHGGQRQHCCLVCNKSFISSYDLKIHVNVHSDERTYMCAECGRQFRCKRSLQRHTAKHGDSSIRVDALSSKNKSPEYPCNICKRNLRNSATLDRHMRTHLSGERSFKCETCSWVFTRASHLRVHIARRHAAAANTTSTSGKSRRRITDTIVMSADGGVERVASVRADTDDVHQATKPPSAIDLINTQVIRKPNCIIKDSKYIVFYS